jgi:hypothetical protein
MTDKEMFRRLLSMDDNKASSVIDKAFDKYFRMLYKIAEDIYDSCIRCYYADYTPTKYDRHGNIKGFNLYEAEDILFDADYNIDLHFDPSNLLKYDVPQKNGKYIEKRHKVLQTVMAGLRGAGSSKNQASGWPREWHAYYPNTYSQYTVWTSNGQNLYEIYKDFNETILEETKDLYYTYIKQLI